MAFSLPPWRDRENWALTTAICETITSKQAYHFISQVIRECCPKRDVPEARMWDFLDCPGSYWTRDYQTSRPQPAWNAPPMISMVRVRVLDYARLEMRANLRRDWTTVKDVRAAEEGARNAFRVALKATFPDNANLELSQEVLDDSAFEKMSRGMVERTTPVEVAADWLRDRGQDGIADHWLQDRRVGVVPWWLRDDVTGFDTASYFDQSRNHSQNCKLKRTRRKVQHVS